MSQPSGSGRARGRGPRVRAVDSAKRALIDAVTFDFWNTLMWEEPGSLRRTRLQIWAEALRGLGAPLDPLRLEAAHDAAHQEYVDSWIAGRQFRVEDAVPGMLAALDGDLGQSVHDALAEGFSEAGRRAAVHPSRGVHECLAALEQAGVRMAIICDIGLTPSPVLRELLVRHRLAAFFDAMVFSDEVGDYKPAPSIFERTLGALGVQSDRAAHVGDRRRTDVAGALAAGMTAVRYNGVYEDDSAGAPEADIVISNLVDLPALLGLPR